jgi:thiopurine S-methyltransferase
MGLIMKPEFWLARWDEEKTGFHQLEYNPRLVEHWPTSGTGQQQIFVPLCGKSLDLRFLAQFGSVTGVELSAIAIKDFFKEWNCEAQTLQLHGASCTHGNNVHLLEADMFKLPTHLNGTFSHAYDRASMIALPPHMRIEYVRVLSDLLEVGGEVLLVTIEYPDGELPGPPFSVGPAWVAEHAGPHFLIEGIESTDTWRADSPLAVEGLTALKTHVFRLKKR